MKARKEIICIGLMAGFVLQTLAVGFNTTSSRRLESPRLRTDSVSRKSDSSNGGVGKAKSGAQSATTSPAKTRRRQSDSSVGDTSLLPEEFDADGAGSMKRSSAEGSRKVLSAEGMTLKEAVKVEYGDGHGETADEALKEAMKDVLQKVVGVYVDSDFRMNNDQIIKDEIITHCNGFIDHYTKIDESDDPDGRGKSVTIKAWVKMRDFVNRMKRMAPRQCVAMDGVLLDAEMDNNVNAEILLREEFEKLDPVLDLMEVRLVDSIRPEVQSSKDGAIVLRYVFQIRYSKDKYYQRFMRRIEALLNQIATKKRTRTVPFKLAQVSCYPWGAANGSGYWKNKSVQAYYLRVDQIWESKPKEVISVIRSITRGGVATIKEWEVSEHLKRVYDEIRREYYRPHKAVQCVFSVLDETGSPLSCAVQNISIENLQNGNIKSGPDFIPFTCNDNVGCMTTESEMKCRNLHGSSVYRSYLDRYIGCVDITVNKADIKKIKSAEIRLEPICEGENE